MPVHKTELLGYPLFTDDSELNDLLASGAEITLELLCRKHPGLVKAVLAAVFEIESLGFPTQALLHRFGRVQARSSQEHYYFASNWCVVSG